MFYLYILYIFSFMEILKIWCVSEKDKLLCLYCGACLNNFRNWLNWLIVEIKILLVYIQINKEIVFLDKDLKICYYKSPKTLKRLKANIFSKIDYCMLSQNRVSVLSCFCITFNMLYVQLSLVKSQSLVEKIIS